MGVFTRDLGLCDFETGERFDEIPFLIPKKKPGIDGEFVMARQEALLKLATDENLNGQDLKILLLYLACTDFENYIRVPQQWIADELKIAKQSVNRSTKKLIEAKILTEGPRSGRHRTYRLNEFYGWKGDSTLYQERVQGYFAKGKKLTSK